MDTAEPFELPIHLRIRGQLHDLTLSCRPGSTFADARGPIAAAVGAAADTRLFLGPGQAEDSWIWGVPPLTVHTRLTDHPTDPDPVGRGLFGISCVGGPDAGGWVSLPAAGILIGRGERADLQILDPQLSRHHLRISPRPDGFLVADLGSTNGFQIDGRAPGRSTLVSPEELIGVGGSLLRVGTATEITALTRPDHRGRIRVFRPPRPPAPAPASCPAPPGPAPVLHRRDIPWIGPIIGAALGVMVAAVTGTWTFLALAVLGPVMLVAGALGERVGGRHRHRRALGQHLDATHRYQAELAVAAGLDRIADWDRHPDPAAVLRRAAVRSTRLWERRPTDEDWLHLRVGTGSRPARLPVDPPPWVGGTPLVVDLSRERLLGIAATDPGLLHWILAQLVVLHSPADLRIRMLADDPVVDEWRRVPHVDTSPGEARTTVLVVTGLALTEDEGVLALRSDPRTLIVCQAPDEQHLPPWCTTVVTVGTSGQVRLAGPGGRACGMPDGLAPSTVRRLVADLAPLCDGSPTTHPEPPAATGLQALLPAITGPGGPTHRAVAVLGRSATGPVTVDLDRDGPHLLVAGTTGSGKSELLTTLIVGLALTNPPSRLSFVLIDYKGGAAFTAVHPLPQVSALVTDLDAGTAARALRGLRAELRSREAALAAAGLSDHGAWERAEPDSAAPRLVIVIDEFATLAADLTDFLTGLLDIAQRGRSLGVHLVLATQRPTGVVSPAIRANISGRICLRVTDPADFVDLIGTVAAAEIDPRTPGRAYLRVGGNRPVLVQTAHTRRLLPLDRSEPVRVLDPYAAGPVGRHTELDLLVQQCRTAAAGQPRTAPPWLPALPASYRPGSTRTATGDPVLGLADHPEERRQHTFGLPAGHLLVTGAAGSGRTNTLRAAAAVAGAELLILDPSRGLADLRAHPRCSTYLDGQEPDLCLRLLDLVLARQESDNAAPALVLIDTWESLLRTADPDPGPLLHRVAEIASRGSATPIRLVVAGCPPLLHGSLRSLFTSSIELTAGAGMGPGSRAVPGRASVLGDEAQIRFQPAGSDDTWTGAPVPARASRTVVRPLPAVVRGITAAAGPIVLGLGGDRADPVALPPGRDGAFLVVGPRGSGVSNTLAVISAASTTRPVVAAVLREPLRAEEVDVRGGPEPLARRLAGCPGPVLLVVDDAHRFENHPAADLFEQFLTRPAPGRTLVLGVRTDALARAYRGFLREAAGFRHGILLQPSPADGTLLEAPLPRRPGPIRPGRGYLCDRGTVTPIQVLLDGP